MSGITGLVAREGDSIDGSTIESMHDRLAHRGPDGGEIWTNGTAGLGHQALRTSTVFRSDPSPQTVSGLTVTADVRLDNRHELREILHVPDSAVSDSTLLAYAYDRWGPACPEHLLGAFAFGIWDHDREHLFCARDHLGVKPFYYSFSPEQFAFASEPPALFEVDRVTRAVNRQRIGGYLGGHPDDRDQTFYEDVARLPPGHHMTVSEKSVDRQCYWAVEDVEPLEPASEEEYERRFRELFLDAVAVRMPENGDVGSFLSGGLDSGSIASAAGHLRASRGGSKPHTFSAVFDDLPECDEREYIQASLDHRSASRRTT